MTRQSSRPVVLVVAPHPDDETLGCGGALLRHKAEGARLHWLLVTRMTKAHGFAAPAVRARDKEIAAVAKLYGFDGVHQLGLPPMRLDAVERKTIVDGIGAAFRKVSPEIVYLPHGGDAHSDHRAAFEAAAACTKWFRYPSVRRVLSYEALSETDFNLDPGAAAFRPNVFVDISAHLDRKIAAMSLYATELKKHPFPRSEESIRALARLRGAAAGCGAAEAFMLLKERLLA